MRKDMKEKTLARKKANKERKRKRKRKDRENGNDRKEQW